MPRLGVVQAHPGHDCSTLKALRFSKVARPKTASAPKGQSVSAITDPKGNFLVEFSDERNAQCCLGEVPHCTGRRMGLNNNGGRENRRK
jgi:hypothetical protein